MINIFDDVIIQGKLQLDEANQRPYVDIDIEKAMEIVELYEKRTGKYPKKLQLNLTQHRNFKMKLFDIKVELIK